MKDKDKAKEQLLGELAEMRRRVAQFEASEVERVQTEKSPLLLDESYQRLFDFFPIGITVLDMKGVILYCNAAVYNKGSYSKDDLVGKHFSKIAPLRARDIPNFVRIFASLIRGKVPKPFAVSYQQRGGATGWTEVSTGLIKVGEERRILVVQNDITERKKAEEQAIVANERLRYLLSASPAVIYLAKTSGDYGATFISANITQMVGYEPREFTGNSSFWIEHVHPDDVELVYQDVPRLFEKEQHSYEYRFRRKDGCYIWIHDEMILVRNEEGKPVEIIGYWADITERKQAEEALRDSEGRFRSLIENASDVVVIVDANGTIRYESPAVESVLGYKPEELVGKDMSVTVRPDDLANTMNAFTEVIKNPGVPMKFELNLRHKDGSVRMVEAIGKNLLNAPGVAGIVANYRDITERKQAEEALRESEERYRSIVSLSGEVGEAVIMLQDTEQGEGIQTFVSDEWPHITGCSREELIGTSFFSLVHPKDHEASRERHRSKMKGKVIPGLFEMTIIRKDGTEVPIEITSAYTTYKGEHANVVYIRDITERKQAEETLKESEQNLIKGQEIGQMGYWRLNPVTQEVEGSDELFRIFELGHDELTLNAFADVVHPEDREYDLEHIQRGMEKGAPWDIEHRLLLKNGNIKWVRAIGEPHLDENGKVIHVMGIVQDITERKKAEEALQESEARYRTFVENSLQGVWQIDEMGITTFASPRMGEILGYSPNEMFGKPFSDFMDEAARKEAEVFFAKRKAGVSEVLDFRFIHKTGRDVYTTLSTVAYMDKGTFSGAVAYVTDITERKQAEEREKQLQQELILSSRLATVGEMASGIAHEINNPLTGVMGFSDLLMKKELPDDIRKDVNIIHEGAKRIASITDRMLTFAHQHEPERTSVNINEIIETTLTMRAYEMKSSNIEVASELAPDIPLTFADAGQLQQVFLNIILNAEVEMKLAHGRGNLTVKTEKTDNTIRVSFKDDGPGIPRINLDRLFDPFFTTRGPDKGTGLGLSICYSIVTQHGGKIYARSRLGKSATFFVELPVVTKEEQLKMAEPAAELPKTLSRARILVVDDDTIVQEFLTTILTEEGHQVEIVENGDDAQERVDSEDYDVILLDIKLPGMSGIELYRYMQKTAKSLARRVVFITGDTMSTDTVDFLATTRAPYIAKPFDGEQLKKDIDRILSQQS